MKIELNIYKNKNENLEMRILINRRRIIQDMEFPTAYSLISNLKEILQQKIISEFGKKYTKAKDYKVQKNIEKPSKKWRRVVTTKKKSKTITI